MRARNRKDYRNCFLCRVMRGLAFGGLGAGLGAAAALLIGASQQNTFIAALFGALFVTLLLNRPPPAA